MVNFSKQNLFGHKTSKVSIAARLSEKKQHDMSILASYKSLVKEYLINCTVLVRRISTPCMLLKWYDTHSKICFV